ncbi:hypothetical protein ACFL2J_00665 [Candidatus Omnitrophota bacterium]
MPKKIETFLPKKTNRVKINMVKNQEKMRINPPWAFKRGFVLLELLLFAAIVFSLCYYAIKAYLKSSPVDKKTQEILSEQGVDTSSHKAVLDSTKSRINDLNNQILDRGKQLDDF